MSKHYVVAIGASAGGLEPIKELFDNMPGETGFSFVIIQHLSADHIADGELFYRNTTMRIIEAQNDMEVELKESCNERTCKWQRRRAQQE